MEVELRKAATGGALTCQLHITDSFALEAAPLTKPPAPRGVSDFYLFSFVSLMEYGEGRKTYH